MNNYTTIVARIGYKPRLSFPAISRLGCYAALLIVLAHAPDVIGAPTLASQSNSYQVAAAEGANSPVVAEAKSGGACSFDQTSVSGDKLIASGWAVLSKDGTLADAVYLEVEYANGKERKTAERSSRADVATYFNSKALLFSGFRVILRRETGAKVKVLQTYKDNLFECEVQYVMQ